MYYTINETTARAAHNMMSMSDYKANSATAGYRAKVDEAAAVLERVKPLCATDAQRDRAEWLLDRYAATLAAAINKDNEIGTRCPSVLIAGPSNFPARKKAAQVAAWDANRDMYRRAEHYLNLLRRAHCQPIKSNDPEAIEALTYKLNRLKAERDRMKATNAYYRQHKTLEGCPDLDPEERRNIESHWAAGWYTGTPYPPYALQNSLANVKRLQDRLNSLQAAKSATHDDEEHDGYTYHEDTEQMRVQLIFDGKPDDDTRALLKSYGFRWSPRNGAWQRQLTDNGRRAARQLMKELDAANNDNPA